MALSGLSFRDLSPEVYSLLPARGPIPHLAKAVSLEALNVFFDGTAHGGRGSTTEVQLCDLTVHGYAGEISNFVSRWAHATLRTCVVQCIASLVRGRLLELVGERSGVFGGLVGAREMGSEFAVQAVQLANGTFAPWT